MLQQMRDQAQNFKWILWAVIFSFLVGFVVLFQGGVGGVTLFGGQSDTAAKVSGREITHQEFRSALQRQDDMLRQLLGTNYKAGQFLNPRGVLDTLIDRAILLEEAERIGVEPSGREVARYIKDIEAFHGESGRFDREKYQEYLRSAGLRPVEFERQVADDLSVSAMNRLLAAGALIPATAVKDAWKRENETATVEYVTFPLEPHLASVGATDDELRAHYDAHQGDYDAGPARQIRWVRLSRDDYQRELEKEDEMRAYYDQNVESIYTLTEDQRRASVILIEAAPGATEEERSAARAKAEAAVQRAKAGEDFATLVKELSDDEATRDEGGDLGPFYQGFQEPAVDAAVFAASEGDVVGPVETPRGFEVLKVTKGAGKKARPFEEVRELVARGLYASQAGEKQAEALKKVQDAIGSKPDLEAAAKAAGVTISEPAWLTRDGSIEALGPNPMLTARAFELEVGQVGEPVSDVGGQVILQVVGERESSPQSFEEAREAVEAAVRERKARDLARAEAETFRQSAAAATSLADAAAGRTVETASDVRRGRPVPGLGVAPDFVAVAFETPVGQVGRVADVPDGVAVLRVTARTEFDEARFEADREVLAQSLQEQQASSLRSSALDRLRETYEDKIRINEKLLESYAPQQQGG